MFNLSRARQIMGWMSDLEMEFLADTASKSNVIFEAGSFQGRSTRAMADNTDGVIHAIDPWRPAVLTSGEGFAAQVGVDDMTFTQFYRNMHDHISKGKVVPHGLRFVNFKPPLIPDFIFIDALHDYENVKADINHAMKLMSKGMLAGHDYDDVNWSGVVKAVNEIFGDKIQVTGSIWSIEL